MHNLEPYYRWLDLYDGKEDEYSPFYMKEYSEFVYSDRLYDHYIHPQWDNIGSSTLFIKVLYADYIENYVIIEMMGEWNDLLHNDIMIFKRNIIEHFMNRGISKFILIGENVWNFHTSDDCYYEEWFEDVEEGWVAAINFRDFVVEEMKKFNLDNYNNINNLSVNLMLL